MADQHKEAAPAPTKGFTLDDLLLLLPTNLAFFNHFSLGNGRCAGRELEFLRCADVSGLKNSRFKCKDQLDAFLECKTQVTDRYRNEKIRQERKKQGRDAIPYKIV